jgi:predicted transcriptional regulator
MDATSSAELTIRLPDELADSVQLLRTATGRDNYDIVTSALRTYLADQRQRDTIRSYFEVVPDGYPRGYFVTVVAAFAGSTQLEAIDRASIEQTFSQINRFAATEVRWGPGRAEVTVGLGVSGHSHPQAAEMAAKMVRNRLVEEHSLQLDERDGGVSVIAVVELAGDVSPVGD